MTSQNWRLGWKFTAHTLLPALTTPPSSLAISPLLFPCEVVKCEQTLCCLSVANFDQRRVSAFCRTRSGEWADGRFVVKSGQVATCLRIDSACSNIYLDLWCQNASNWVESTACFMKADLCSEMSVISVPRYPCQTWCANQPWTVCKFTVCREWCSSTQQCGSL